MDNIGWIDYVEKLGPAAVALIAAVLVVVGWYVNSRKALNNEIEKEARQYRIDMCLAVIKLHEKLQDCVRNEQRINPKNTKVIELFEEILPKVLLYGGKKEQDLLNKIISNFRIAGVNDGAKNVEEASAHANISITENELFNTCVERFRKELKLEKIKR